MCKIDLTDTMNLMTLGSWSILAFSILCLHVHIAVADDVIVTFGDSITSGFRSIPYSAKLQEKIGTKTRVINRGVNGERTDEGAERISRVLAADKPIFVLIMEGANDAIKGVPSSIVQSNISLMIDRSKAAGAIPIIANITPNNRHNLTEAIRQDYNAAIASIAVAKGVVLVDAFGAVVDNMASMTFDGLHPNPAGSNVLAEQFNAVLPYASLGRSGVNEAFIATAIFGSDSASEVVLLKNFRDRFLLTNAAGTSFIDLYNRYSSRFAHLIARHNSSRVIVRVCLYPFIVLICLMLHDILPIALALLACLMVIVWTGGRMLRLKSRKRAWRPAARGSF